MAMKILDVGQCGFDGPRMKQILQDSLDATVVQADTAEEARQLVARERFDIALVNRILAADGTEGLPLVGELAKHSGIPVMLVSDRETAQEDAVALGATRGFGKAALHEPETLELIREAVTKRPRSGGKRN